VSADERSAQWTKSSASVGTGACVELAAVGDLIGLRHSREHEPVLCFTQAEIAAFFQGVRDGEFDHLLTVDQG
jgi:hypothetical protein